MNRRQLDLALLAGIGVLLVLILILALSGAPSRVGDISDPVERVSDARAAEAASDPDDAGTDAVDDATPDAAPADAAPSDTTTDTAAATTTPDTATPDADAPDVTAEEAVAASEAGAAEVLTGSVPLERVGFAYATGAEGACGVPLEAWAYVAVSRDLLTEFPCGTAVTLSLDDEIAGRREVTAQVGDTMGAEIAQTVNIFVGEDEPALEYGVTGGTLSQ